MDHVKRLEGLESESKLQNRIEKSKFPYEKICN